MAVLIFFYYFFNNLKTPSAWPRYTLQIGPCKLAIKFCTIVSGMYCIIVFEHKCDINTSNVAKASLNQTCKYVRDQMKRQSFLRNKRDKLSVSISNGHFFCTPWSFTYHVCVADGFHFIHVVLLQNAIEKRVQSIEHPDNVHGTSGRGNGGESHNITEENAHTLKGFRLNVLAFRQRRGHWPVMFRANTQKFWNPKFSLFKRAIVCDGLLWQKLAQKLFRSCLLLHKLLRFLRHFLLEIRGVLLHSPQQKVNNVVSDIADYFFESIFRFLERWSFYGKFFPAALHQVVQFVGTGGTRYTRS